VRNFFRSVNIWQSYEQERDCLVHLAKTLLKDGENARNSNVNACNFAKTIFTDFNFFTHRLSEKFLKVVKI